MPVEKFYDYYTRDEMVIKFLPLVENMARKFATSQQASGVLSILDLLQVGGEALTKAVDKLDWELLIDLCPELNYKNKPKDREFFFNVLNTLIPNSVDRIVRNSFINRQQKSKIEDDN